MLIPWWRRARKSQCEDWYQVTPYISEFWCAITDLPFLYVAWVYSFWPLAVVGMTSLVHHAIPCQWIVEADKAFACAMIAHVTWTVFLQALTELIFSSFSLCCSYARGRLDSAHSPRGHYSPNLASWMCRIYVLVSFIFLIELFR